MFHGISVSDLCFFYRAQKKVTGHVQSVSSPPASTAEQLSDGPPTERDGTCIYTTTGPPDFLLCRPREVFERVS